MPCFAPFEPVQIDQLNLYGFTRSTRGPYLGSYFHPSLVRGDYNKCLEIVRVSNPTEGGQAQAQEARQQTMMQEARSSPQVTLKDQAAYFDPSAASALFGAAAATTASLGGVGDGGGTTSIAAGGSGWTPSAANGFDVVGGTYNNDSNVTTTADLYCPFPNPISSSLPSSSMSKQQQQEGQFLLLNQQVPSNDDDNGATSSSPNIPEFLYQDIICLFGGTTSQNV